MRDTPPTLSAFRDLSWKTIIITAWSAAAQNAAPQTVAQMNAAMAYWSVLKGSATSRQLQHCRSVDGLDQDGCIHTHRHAAHVLIVSIIHLSCRVLIVSIIHQFWPSDRCNDGACQQIGATYGDVVLIGTTQRCQEG